LSDETVKQGTPEYHAANEIYQALDFAEFAMGAIKQKEFDFGGGVESGMMIRARKRKA
jgi:hypothetical protein